MQRQCSTCKEVKLFKNFAKNKTKKDGINSTCKICHKEYNNKHFRRYLYNLSIEEYNSLLKQQNNTCAICKQILEKPVVDHCHKTGKVRGLLCQRCNIALGAYENNRHLLDRFKEYLNG